MHPIDQDGLKQITEELLACGVHIDEPREALEVGILEPTEDMAPREPRVPRLPVDPNGWSRFFASHLMSKNRKLRV